MELFPEFEKGTQDPVAPLADRMRPEGWEKFAGQEHLVGEGLPLRELVESGSRLSFLLWGPPGTG
ncbi:MAG: replication-associated recombination protein A, partial [Nitrospina sp.]|nr:replication-associated recombination protein A [Nitrospina sp.]